jgi:hypothetical protein
MGLTFNNQSGQRFSGQVEGDPDLFLLGDGESGVSGLGIAMFGAGGGGLAMAFDGQVDGAPGFGVLREDSSGIIGRHG